MHSTAQHGPSSTLREGLQGACIPFAASLRAKEEHHFGRRTLPDVIWLLHQPVLRRWTNPITSMVLLVHTTGHDSPQGDMDQQSWSTEATVPPKNLADPLPSVKQLLIATTLCWYKSLQTSQFGTNKAITNITTDTGTKKPTPLPQAATSKWSTEHACTEPLAGRSASPVFSF